MNEPARIRLSALARVMQCPASLNMSSGYPNKDSPAALEGTLAHAEFEQCMVFGTEATEYDIQSALDYVNNASIASASVSTEVKVTPKQLERDDTWGTADIIIDYVGGEVVEVVDLKYGKGIIVEPEENWQLIAYGLGAMWGKPNIKKVKLTIAQPRIEHPDGVIRSFEYSRNEMEEFTTKIKTQLSMVDMDDPVFGPSKSGCQWCAAKHECKPRSEFNLKKMGMHFDKIEPEKLKQADKMNMFETVQVLDSAAMIKAWVADVEESALHMIKAGKKVPGYKLVAGRANRKWANDETTTMEDLKTIGLRLKDYTVNKLISPAAMDKVAKKEKLTISKITKIKELIEKQSGKATLVHETDRRPSISIELPDKPFGPVVH